MKKKLYSLVLAILVAGSCLADEVPSLKINKSDGESAVLLSELLSIKYADSDMVVNMKDGSQMVFPLDDIIVMQLGQAPTAINSIFSDKAETYVITDLKGNVVSRDKGERFTLPSQKGVYIISSGDKSRKILVR